MTGIVLVDQTQVPVELWFMIASFSKTPHTIFSLCRSLRSSLTTVQLKWLEVGATHKPSFEEFICFVGDQARAHSTEFAALFHINHEYITILHERMFITLYTIYGASPLKKIRQGNILYDVFTSKSLKIIVDEFMDNFFFEFAEPRDYEEYGIIIDKELIKHMYESSSRYMLIIPFMADDAFDTIFPHEVMYFLDEHDKQLSELFIKLERFLWPDQAVYNYITGTLYRTIAYPFKDQCLKSVQTLRLLLDRLR